jgi:hypothetical protein
MQHYIGAGAGFVSLILGPDGHFRCARILSVKLFLSCSGERSYAAGQALRDHIPVILQAAEPWLSSEDIGKGHRWSQQLSENLATIDFGIICVTPENQHAPWILFEAGALSKSLATGYVATFLLGMNSAEVVGPLAQFQSTKPDEADVFKLFETINRRMSQPLAQSVLETAFRNGWPELGRKLKAAASVPVARTARRGERDMLEEVLDRLRSFERSFTPAGVSSASLIGVDRIVPGWDAIDWEPYLDSTSRLDLLARDGNPWREENEGALRNMARRDGVHIRVVLPDPADDAVLLEANRANPFDLTEARERINKSIQGYLALRHIADARATIEIFLSRQVPLYAWCRTDGVAMIRPYAHGPRPTMPAFLLSDHGSLFQICQADFDMLVERASPVS